MNETWSRITAAVGLVLLAAATGVAVWGHERTLSQGRILLLQLAPVDPRSLMQGDYMALRFAVGNSIVKSGSLADGRIVVKVGTDDVATFARMHQEGQPLAADEALLEYRMRQSGARIVTDAYFFQEGRAKEYEGARYGELRVRPDGQALLVGLRDVSRLPMGTPRYAR